MSDANRQHLGCSFFACSAGARQARATSESKRGLRGPIEYEFGAGEFTTSPGKVPLFRRVGDIGEVYAEHWMIHLCAMIDSRARISQATGMSEGVSDA